MVVVVVVRWGCVSSQPKSVKASRVAMALRWSVVIVDLGLVSLIVLSQRPLVRLSRAPSNLFMICLKRVVIEAKIKVTEPG